jgi:adenylate cyclase
VGHGGRIDYTAHGDAVNMAARLQEASKTLGITVLIGPRASAQTSLPVTAAGEVELRSFGRVQVSTLPVSSGS